MNSHGLKPKVDMSGVPTVPAVGQPCTKHKLYQYNPLGAHNEPLVLLERYPKFTV